jgi:hypothetical protein
MKLLVVAVLAVSPTVFAQARGGARRVAAPARRPAAPVISGSGVRPGGPVIGPAFAPLVFFGYYPNPLYYDSPAQDENAPAPAYYGADPNGQGYPSVIVNPNYVPETAHPVMRDYSYLPATADDAAAQPNPNASVIFLIAMKDHTIYPAVAYWVENDTLNYVTQQGVRNRVSLGLVDREFSMQLNKERSIDFGLPEVKLN